MNNNNNNRDNDGITTKKGFLISLPGKSKGTGESTINMAKTISDVPHNSSTSKPQENRNSKNKKFDRKNKAVKGAAVSDGEKNSSPDRNDRRDKKHHGKQFDNKNKKRFDGGNSHDKQKNVPDKNEKTFEAAVQKNEKFQDNRNDSRNENRNDNRNNKNGRNRHDRKKGHGKNRNDFRNEQKNENVSAEVNTPVHNSGKNPTVTPISPLSSGFSSVSKQPSHSFGYDASQNAESEISLEEKYKNAVPLAQQIAEEAEKARHPKYNSANSEKQEIIGVRFREAGKIYYFDPDGKTVPFGAPVIVETARGNEYGFTAISNRMIPGESIVTPLKKLVRIASEDDTRKYNANKALEKDGAKIFREKVEKLGLEMNLIYVEYTFDNSKLLFYFTAESRVDFRELVKELAGVFRTRIELRQIGVRDEAKVLGGLGVCGRATCCSTFLGDFAQVSIKMAKDQSLSLNAAKISGACGKLMCCLRYEDKVYEQENAITPKVGALVETAEGKGTVTERNTLKGTVKVALETQEAAPPKLFSRDEVKVIGHVQGENDSEHDDSADEIKDEE